MLTMIRLRKRENRGAGRGELSIRKRRSAKSPILEEMHLSKKKPVVITGEAGSNKSRTLQRLYKNHDALHAKRPALCLSAFDPIAAWIDDTNFQKWLSEHRPDASNQWSKLNALPEWIAETKAVVYFDDAHKLAGRKMHMGRRILDASSQFYLTAATVGRMPPTLRLICDSDRIQMVKLSTNASYDATKALIFCLLIVMGAAGAWEAAIVIGIFTQLASGRNALKSD